MSKGFQTISSHLSDHSSNNSSSGFQTVTEPSDTLSDTLSNSAAEISEDISESTGEITETTVLSYFEALNVENFQAVASLFSETGVLYPPFDSAVTGHEAIVTYLETEAKGLQLTPKRCVTQPLDDGNRQCKVIGQVQTPLFGVNVGWTFVLNSDAEILSVQVKLLAALEELLKLQPKS